MRQWPRWLRSDAVAAMSTALVLVLVACSPRIAPLPAPDAAPTPAVRSDSAAGVLALEDIVDGVDRVVRVAIGGGVARAAIGATGAFLVAEGGGRGVLVRGTGRDAWHVERRGRLLRVAGTGGDATPWREGPFVVRPGGAAVQVRFDGRRYRGELWFAATDTGLLVVNRLLVEDYLRGVVPLELGTRAATDLAALEAQAIAARSYAYVRVPATETVPRSGYHLTATVQHQVYGGADVEHVMVDQAIDRTSGLVLRFGGRVVDGPYSSSCGGRSADPRDVWAGATPAGYLQSVSDIDPRTGRAYCDISPRNRWTATFDEPLVRAAVVRHLGARGSRGSTAPVVQSVRVASHTASGRVGSLVMRTDRGDVTLAGNDIRSALRDARGAILSSTYFEVQSGTRSGNRLSSLVLTGHGHGHGVGMCQWGAIGRARSGQDVRAILRHYYPGTVVGFAE